MDLTGHLTHCPRRKDYLCARASTYTYTKPRMSKFAMEIKGGEGDWIWHQPHSRLVKGEVNVVMTRPQERSPPDPTLAHSALHTFSVT